MNDWELDDIERFLYKLQGKLVNREGEDRIVWRDSINEVFYVKDLYFVLELACVIPSPLGIIWNTWVPSSWGKVLTLD